MFHHTDFQLELLGAEFHESVFELLPADEDAAEALRASALLQSFRYSLEAGARIGRDFNAAKQFKKWMMEAGFVDVVEKQFLSPVNAWPLDPRDREIGRWCKSILFLSLFLGGGGALLLLLLLLLS